MYRFQEILFAFNFKHPNSKKDRQTLSFAPLTTEPTTSPSHNVTNSVMYGICNVIHVPPANPPQINAPRIHRVNMKLGRHVSRLSVAQTRIRIHPPPFRQVFPVARRSPLLQGVLQELPRLGESIRHRPDALPPPSAELGIFQNPRDRSGAVARRIPVGSADDRRDRGSDALDRFRGRVDEGQVPDAAILEHGEVLGEGLGAEELEAVVSEVSDDPGVFFEVLV